MCIRDSVSQWGQDFRPSYLRIAEFVHRLPRRPAVGAVSYTHLPYTDDEKQARAARKNAYYVELIGSLTRADILPGALDTLSYLKERGLSLIHI